MKAKNNKEKALKNLKDRIKLLSRGIVLEDESVPVIHLQSIQGGAGPQGVNCYIGEEPGNYKSQISLVIYPKDHYLAEHAIPAKWWTEEQSDEDPKKRKIVFTDDGLFLEEAPFNWHGGWFDRKTARIVKAKLHPYQTYSMCLYRGCKHLEQNQGCKFCTTSLLVDKFHLPKRLPDKMNLKFLKLALTNNSIRSITLTSGTIDTPEKTGKELLSFASFLKEKTNLSIHVQIEPIFDQTLLKELSQVADTIGIFLESFDENVRQMVCPGKAQAFSPEEYMKSWEMAVSCFGRGKVFTTDIIGFDEDLEVTVKGIERAARIGVLTSILLLRVGAPGLGDYSPSYIGKEDTVLQLYQELGEILVRNSIDNISPNNAGCMGCHGCSATKEAVLWARLAG